MKYGLQQWIHPRCGMYSVSHGNWQNHWHKNLSIKNNLERIKFTIMANICKFRNKIISKFVWCIRGMNQWFWILAIFGVAFVLLVYLRGKETEGFGEFQQATTQFVTKQDDFFSKFGCKKFGKNFSAYFHTYVGVYFHTFVHLLMHILLVCRTCLFLRDGVGPDAEASFLPSYFRHGCFGGAILAFSL